MICEENKEFIFLTLTTPNVKGDSLEEEIKNYNKSFKKLMKRKEVKDIVKGYIRKLEVTYQKEQYINTETYKKALPSSITMTNTIVDYILEGINKYLLELAKEQIKLAFIQSEEEVKDLQQRTREGIETARLNGKQIGQVKGVKLTTKKSLEAKKLIEKYSKDFQGNLKDTEVIKLIGVSRNSYYKYKKELVNELSNNLVL